MEGSPGGHKLKKWKKRIYFRHHTFTRSHATFLLLRERHGTSQRMSPKSLSTPISRATTRTACCVFLPTYAASMPDTWTPLRNPKFSLRPRILYALMDKTALDTTSHAGQFVKPLRRQNRCLLLCQHQQHWAYRTSGRVCRIGGESRMYRTYQRWLRWQRRGTDSTVWWFARHFQHKSDRFGRADWRQ